MTAGGAGAPLFKPTFEVPKMPLSELTNHELAVAYLLNGVNLFGFDTYKHENRTKAARLRSERDEIEAELKSRTLVRPSGGLRADLEAAAEADPRVVELTAANERFVKSMA
jgi:hypothetical protein